MKVQISYEQHGIGAHDYNSGMRIFESDNFGQCKIPCCNGNCNGEYDLALLASGGEREDSVFCNGNEGGKVKKSAYKKCYNTLKFSVQYLEDEDK